MINSDISKILLVDDSPASLLIMQRYLTREYIVTTAENGTEALQALRNDDYDLVLLDINMPGMDGFEVLREIRSQSDYVPVVLMSALTDSQDIARGLMLGANDYLTKPVDRQVVLARVRTQLALKTMLDQKQDSIDQLRANQMRKDRFLSIVSHDLKNPMSHIRMAQYLLRDFIGPQPEAHKLLNNIEMSLMAMEDIVQEFLDSAALNNRKVDLERTPALIEDIIWDVVLEYMTAAQRKEITLQVGEVEGCITADTRRMAQAIGNLISNAIKYSPRGSTIRVYSVLFSDRVRLYVCDEGPGIPPEERARLFTEFGKLSTRPTEGESSTGLGLWIVKHLVEMHGGQVGASFPAEGGSQFWIEVGHQPAAANTSDYAVSGA